MNDDTFHVKRSYDVGTDRYVFIAWLEPDDGDRNYAWSIDGQCNAEYEKSLIEKAEAYLRDPNYPNRPISAAYWNQK